MMNRKRLKANQKLALVLVLILVFLMAAVTLWRWLEAAPPKPASIPQGDYTYTSEYAEHRIRQMMKQRHLPSVAVALIDDQDAVWQEVIGLANVESEIPAQAETVYKLYSIAKVFTAIETMRLVEEGLVDLDAPITETIPDFSIQSRFPESGPITIRSILAHHSGLPRNECNSPMSGPGDYAVLGEMVASMANCHMAHPVGERYKYINIGPEILGYIIQELRGESFARYMKEHLLSPIGMDSSAFITTGIPPQKEFALGYEYYKGKYYPYEQGDILHLSSGNLYSTIEDMSAFAKFIFQGGEAGGVQIIHQDTLQLMFEDQYPSQEDPQPMGLGWKTARVLGSEKLVWHDGGSAEGIGSLVALLPERKLGVVLFANEVSFQGSLSVFLALDILERMLETKYGLILPEREAAQPVDVDWANLDEFQGKYIALGQVMDVSLSGDRLKASIQGMKFDLIPVSGSKFRVGHWLLNLGLDDLLQLPIDLRDMQIEFQVGSETDEEVMIINFGGVVYEVCPQYPDVTDTPALWEELTGAYDLYPRLSSGEIGTETVGRDEIVIEEGVLMMPGVVGQLIPINVTEIIILSGPFAGETMVYKPDTGFLYHQWMVYKPSDPDFATSKR